MRGNEINGLHSMLFFAVIIFLEYYSPVPLCRIIMLQMRPLFRRMMVNAMGLE
jgi:hypothetical protein